MEALEENLQTYAAQLEQVKLALSCDAQNDDLKTLKTDLEQLITLTKEHLLEEKKKALLDQVDSLQESPSSTSNNRDETHDEKVEGVDDSKEEDLQKELEEKLLGLRCRAPHVSRGSGVISMANAVVFHVESFVQDDVKVRVVFSHPTSQDMVPCQYFLKGTCRFGNECKFSHGEVVSLIDLDEYSEPDFNSLSPGSAVLAKQEEDEVWSRACVVHVDNDLVHVRFSSGREHVSLPRESLFPLANDAGEKSSEEKSCPSDLGATDLSRDNAEAEEVTEFTPVSMLGNLATEELFAWECHTRGVGSKLMAKMGYVAGAGLGRHGAGRVLPVTATIYPSGKSLDWCMEARERAGGGDALSVERQMLKQKAKEERKSAARVRAQEERDRREHALFDLINRSIAGRSGDPGHKVNLADLYKKRPPSMAKGSSSQPTAGGSSKKREENLNLKAFKVSEEIRKAEKEVARLEASAARHRGRGEAGGSQERLAAGRRHLAALKAKERGLNAAKSKHESRKKLEIF